MVSVNVKIPTLDFAIDNFDAVVVRWPVTERISQQRGDKIESYSTTTEINAYVHRYSKEWIFDPIGKVEGGDAIMLVKDDVTVAKNDKIESEGETFKIRHIITRYVQGTAVYKACNLFIFDDTTS